VRLRVIDPCRASACLPRGNVRTSFDWRVVVLCALCFALNAARPAHGDETAELISRLRKASEALQGISLNEQDKLDLWRFGFYDPGRLLANIGLAQIGLGDLAGAEATARALPVKSKCLNCGDEYGYFLNDLSTALVRAGRIDRAFEVLKVHYDQWGAPSDARLAIARAQAKNGDSKGAKTTCEEAIHQVETPSTCACGPPDPFDLPSNLVDPAFTQLSIGDASGAKRTRDRIESLLQKLPKKGHMRAFVSARLAVLDTRLGDLARARRDLQDAQQAINFDAPTRLDRLNYSWCWTNIANATCRVGDIPGALRAAAKCTDHSGEGYLDIAIFQWSHGDFDVAEKTLLAAPHSGTDDLMLVEIAKAQAESGGDYKRALACVGEIKNGLRRAQGTLEVAAIMARQGKCEQARALARKLDSPRVERIGLPQGTQFKFEDLHTWGASYEFFRGFTMASMESGREMDGDLLAAAVRCRVALDGRNAIPLVKDMSEFGWDVGKAAEAQASEGDAAGALTWADKLSVTRRLIALIGTAYGHIDRRASEQKIKPAERRLGRRHSLLRYAFPSGRLYGEFD
jgi:tetratricopeptide (TPR) repeat protein